LRCSQLLPASRLRNTNHAIGRTRPVFGMEHVVGEMVVFFRPACRPLWRGASNETKTKTLELLVLYTSLAMTNDRDKLLFEGKTTVQLASSSTYVQCLSVGRSKRTNTWPRRCRGGYHSLASRSTMDWFFTAKEEDCVLWAARQDEYRRRGCRNVIPFRHTSPVCEL
jgi:hypothetical protein